MKTKVLVIAGLAVLSTSAFASKARLEALSGNNGAAKLYISDNRNIFRNAATINTHKNYVVTEWGTSTAADDSVSAPRAEGGFFNNAGALSYGLYFGNNGDNNGRTEFVKDDGTTPVPAANPNFQKGYLPQSNALDLFLGGDVGLQWGAKLHYANSKDEPTGGIARKNTALGLGLGVIAGAAEGYINVDLSDKSKGNNRVAGTIPTTTAAQLASDEYKQKPTFTVGGSFVITDYTIFAELMSGKTEITEGSAATKTVETFKDMDYKVGVGRVMEINPTARLVMDASVASTSRKVNETGINTTYKTTSLTLPLTMGFEAEATSWLTLRGSVGQNIVLNETKVSNSTDTNVVNGKRTNGNTTTVNGGASLNFGKLALDGSIGKMATGTINTDDLMSRVGVTYSF